MKYIILSFAILFSTVSTANSGLADRINEVRTYPNKTVSTHSDPFEKKRETKHHTKMEKRMMQHGDAPKGQ